MNDLITALKIFLKYGNPRYPTHCEHDKLYIMEITFDEVSIEDQEALAVLGFMVDQETGQWFSYRYGSA